MPVSKKPRKDTSTKSKRVVTKRTQGWALLRDSRNTINLIMNAVAAIATIGKDADSIELKEGDKAVGQDAMRELKRVLTLDADSGETILMRSEEIYSRVLGLINDQPYVKESQISPDVNKMAELLNQTTQTVLGPLGNLFDIYSSASNLSPYHNSLLSRIEDQMRQIAA